MCLLIVKEAGLKVPREMLDNADTNNPDGMGVAFVENGELVVNKGWFVFDSFYDIIKQHEEKAMMIHFRAASPQMDVTDEMCHPFFVETTNQIFLMENGKPRFQWAIGHNGRINYVSSAKKSDTFNFVTDIIHPIVDQNPWHFDQPANRYVMERCIDSTNKIAIMRYDKSNDEQTMYILNPKGGIYEKGYAHFLNKVWYSNESYKKIKATYAPNYQLGYGDNGFGEGGHGQASPKSQAPEIPKSPPPLPYSETEFDGIFENKFSISDAAGWFWSYSKHGWLNKNTNAFCSVLTTRTERPMYIQLREKRLELVDKLVADAAAEEAKRKQGPEKKSDKLGQIKNRLNELDAAVAKQKSIQMASDFQCMERDAFFKKYGITVDDASKKKEITVPRDEDVIEAEDGKADKLGHLSKSQKKKLRRMCSDWFKEDSGLTTNGVSNSDMIAWARSEYRKLFIMSEAEFDDPTIDELLLDETSLAPKDDAPKAPADVTTN